MDWYVFCIDMVLLCTRKYTVLHLAYTRIINEHKHFYLVKKKPEREKEKVLNQRAADTTKVEE